MTSTKEAENISERLARVAEATNDDGSIRALVVGFEDHDRADKISMTVETELGTRLRREWPQPEKWTDEEPFVRAVDAMGGSPGALERMVGDQVDVHPDDDGSFTIPGEQLWRERLASLIPERLKGSSWPVIVATVSISVVMTGTFYFGHATDPDLVLTGVKWSELTLAAWAMLFLVPSVVFIMLSDLMVGH